MEGGAKRRLKIYAILGGFLGRRNTAGKVFPLASAGLFLPHPRTHPNQIRAEPHPSHIRAEVKEKEVSSRNSSSDQLQVRASRLCCHSHPDRVTYFLCPDRNTPRPYRETGLAIPLSHCVFCGVADYSGDCPGKPKKSRFASRFANLGSFCEFGVFFPGRKQREFTKIGQFTNFGGLCDFSLFFSKKKNIPNSQKLGNREWGGSRKGVFK